MHLRRNVFLLLVAFLSGQPWLCANPCKLSNCTASTLCTSNSAERRCPEQMGGGVVIPVQLSKSIDAKKAKPAIRSKRKQPWIYSRTGKL